MTNASSYGSENPGSACRMEAGKSKDKTSCVSHKETDDDDDDITLIDDCNTGDLRGETSLPLRTDCAWIRQTRSKALISV
jgi:hypothetical protein